MYDENSPRLILADGTILIDSTCGYSERHLYCWIKNKSLQEVFMIFTDPNKTRIIRDPFRSTETIYKNFTEFQEIQVMEERIQVCLTGGTKEIIYHGTTIEGGVSNGGN